MYVADQRSMERRFAEIERDVSDEKTRNERAIAQMKIDKSDDIRVTHIEDRLKIVEVRPANMRSYLIALAGLALTLLGIVVSAYFAARGSS
jgi:Flp pilus assembly secretin CpaC